VPEQTIGFSFACPLSASLAPTEAPLLKYKDHILFQKKPVHNFRFCNYK
ncbi:unnamed protein product, partial [Prunus brigantina]